MVCFADAASESHRQPPPGRSSRKPIPEATIKAIAGRVGNDSSTWALKQPLLTESTAAASQQSTPTTTLHQGFSLPRAASSSRQSEAAAENRRHVAHDIETCSHAAVYGDRSCCPPGEAGNERGVENSNAGSAAHVCVHCGHGEPSQVEQPLNKLLVWS